MSNEGWKIEGLRCAKRKNGEIYSNVVASKNFNYETEDFKMTIITGHDETGSIIIDLAFRPSIPNDLKDFMAELSTKEKKELLATKSLELSDLVTQMVDRTMRKK